MENFQSVQLSSLYFRLFPRLVVSCFLAGFISLGLVLALSFFKYNFAFGVSTIVGLVILVLLSVITFVTAYLEYTNLKYLIEEHALFLKEGVFEVDTETIPFQKIRNASYFQNLLQRFYGVGDLIIDQEPESYTWVGIDVKTARIILDAVSARSNIQPISVEPNQPNPYPSPQT